MATLLKNGNILRTSLVQTHDGKVSGDAVVEICPTDPRYDKNILWLPKGDKARAKRLSQRAKRTAPA